LHARGSERVTFMPPWPEKNLICFGHNLAFRKEFADASVERQNRRLAGLHDTLLPKILSGGIELPAEEVAG
jgi:hypothetical protein